ncbi:MAG TPA: S-methyl-5'-thioadenosine phosphorylase [Acidobacteriaceae bacterium]|nr:S-methyl-5'-thioadenosine phosphorylase [Acidobacteriaceae bacterium]
MFRAEIGIIGGSGLYNMPGLTNVHEDQVSTPFGDPSDWLTFGELHGRKVAFLARHGRGHFLLPSDINYRANIYAMKQVGVCAILSISAVGSLKEEHKPGTFVIPDQFIDRTYARRSTFFGPDVAAHVSMADPVCCEIGNALQAACDSSGVTAVRGGTYVCMEGPQFSTRAESNLYRSWGADVIGMTNLQEAKLAREAEICYGTLAMVTDYDCWHPGHDSVTTDQIVAVLNQNSAAAQKVLDAAVANLPGKRSCHCQSALKDAIITRHSVISLATKQRLRLLLDKYIQPSDKPQSK